MSSVVSEGIILVGVVVAAALLSVSFMSSIADMQSSTMSATRDIGVTIRTSVEVIHAVNVTNKNIKIWVKNVGSNPIYDGEIERADLRALDDPVFPGVAICDNEFVPGGINWLLSLR